MIAQIAIDADGAVTCVVDSDDALSEDEQRLQGLKLDDMVNRASSAALDAWFAIHGGNSEHTDDDDTD